MRPLLFFAILLIVSASQSQNVDFKSFKTQFPQETLPFMHEFDPSYYDQSDCLSLEYSCWFFNNRYEERKIIPIAGFSVYEDLWLNCFLLGNDTELESIYFCVYDNSENLRDSISYGVYFSGAMIFTVIRIDEFYNVLVNLSSMERMYFWQESQNHCASLLTACGERKESSDKRMKILQNGTIFKDVLPLSLIEDYLFAMSIGNFEEAYSMQKVPAWGTFEQFSSTSAFGGICNVDIDSVKLVYEDDNTAQVICHALYTDTVNWGAEITQTFYLRMDSSSCYIEKMTVGSNSFERKMRYSNSNFIYSQFDMSEIDEDGFNFSLQNVSIDKDIRNKMNKSGEISGYAKFISTDHAIYEENCTLHFYFKGRSKVEIKEMNCSDFRHKDLNFSGTYVYRNLSF